jgi:hypothetical protein
MLVLKEKTDINPIDISATLMYVVSTLTVLRSILFVIECFYELMFLLEHLYRRVGLGLGLGV